MYLYCYIKEHLSGVHTKEHLPGGRTKEYLPCVRIQEHLQNARPPRRVARATMSCCSQKLHPEDAGVEHLSRCHPALNMLEAYIQKCIFKFE